MGNLFNEPALAFVLYEIFLSPPFYITPTVSAQTPTTTNTPYTHPSPIEKGEDEEATTPNISGEVNDVKMDAVGGYPRHNHQRENRANCNFEDKFAQISIVPRSVATLSGRVLVDHLSFTDSLVAFEDEVIVHSELISTYNGDGSCGRFGGLLSRAALLASECLGNDSGHWFRCGLRRIS
ncbi:hypothetical protein J7T55_010322 [Diaporthe amygdali]|uniref:uncharacterized protein n=1 Tax=Phomopsis amygdali TaxID=1214568 RepID=UPI0022FF0A13|nr:uncharacterized protein J7T55_010322 [Diaporthe amygdali]KAJ0107715.1 hypothetical protein J7T55_010322 [Diaporthe amygdali]